MNPSIEERRRIRLRVFHKAYELSHGNAAEQFTQADLEAALELAHADADPAVEYLMAEGLLDTRSFGILGITHQGIREFEEAQAAPDVATQHFPALNFLYIGHVEHSRIQQGTTESHQTQTVHDDASVSALRDLIREIRAAGIDVPADARTSFESDLSTIEAQLTRPTPRWHFIKESLQSVRTILEAAGGSLLAEKVAEWLRSASGM